MQYKDAMELQKVGRGRNCEHPDISKEYYLGTHTGDYVCTSCGYAFDSRSTWDEFRSNLESLKQSKADQTDGGNEDKSPES
jgi:hypothetical protein